MWISNSERVCLSNYLKTRNPCFLKSTNVGYCGTNEHPWQQINALRNWSENNEREMKTKKWMCSFKFRLKHLGQTLLNESFEKETLSVGFI